MKKCTLLLAGLLAGGLVLLYGLDTYAWKGGQSPHGHSVKKIDGNDKNVSPIPPGVNRWNPGGAIRIEADTKVLLNAAEPAPWVIHVRVVARATGDALRNIDVTARQSLSSACAFGAAVSDCNGWCDVEVAAACDEAHVAATWVLGDEVAAEATQRICRPLDVTETTVVLELDWADWVPVMLVDSCDQAPLQFFDLELLVAGAPEFTTTTDAFGVAHLPTGIGGADPEINLAGDAEFFAEGQPGWYLSNGAEYRVPLSLLIVPPFAVSVGPTMRLHIEGLPAEERGLMIASMAVPESDSSLFARVQGPAEMRWVRFRQPLAWTADPGAPSLVAIGHEGLELRGRAFVPRVAGTYAGIVHINLAPACRLVAKVVSKNPSATSRLSVRVDYQLDDLAGASWVESFVTDTEGVLHAVLFPGEATVHISNRFAGSTKTTLQLTAGKFVTELPLSLPPGGPVEGKLDGFTRPGEAPGIVRLDRLQDDRGIFLIAIPTRDGPEAQGSYAFFFPHVEAGHYSVSLKLDGSEDWIDLGLTVSPPERAVYYEWP